MKSVSEGMEVGLFVNGKRIFFSFLLLPFKSLGEEIKHRAEPVILARSG